VRDHHGYIDLDTTVGKGSTFFVFLPVFRNPTPKINGLNLPHGSEAILVVDDDELQVNVLVSLLQALGYRVMGVQSGEECIHLVKDEGYRFDLIILDMILADGLDGLGTYEILRKLVPQQKVVLISGFSKAARNVAKAQELGAGIYLRKPLTIERVAKTVREALDSSLQARKGVGGRHGKRILVVDDEQMIRKLFGMIIVSGLPDTVIDQADNGAEAVKAFEEGHHDLIVMDLQMPVLDGREAFAAISRVCARKKWAVPPVIFCTGFAPHESLSAIVGDGSIHCLIRKPVKADALLEAVRQRIH
jgi:CheY-like chemotaxis protein